jgi:hypothetical protein
MKKGLLFIFLIMTAFTLYSQKDTALYSSSFSGREYLREGTNTNITIYPVPVKENNFTIKAEKDISFIKITNIIGQDIYKNRYSNLQTIRIFLENPKRGMYLVTIIFADDTRVVKKIMVEETD